MTTTAEKLTTETAEAASDQKPMVMPERRRALGRGLESLLPGGPRPVPAGTETQPAVIAEIHATAARSGADQVIQIPLELIDSNPYQTRVLAEDDETEEGASTLRELADSIRTNGVIQPITVRPGEAGHYILITGERRCKASRLAGKDKVPAILKQVSEQQAAEMTIVENLQRRDLNCMEQAAAFARLSQTFGLTQEQIGQRVGLSRETVSNYMRLLKLPGTVMQYLRDGQLDFSEARVLLTVLDHDLTSKIADEAVKKHLSVWELEELVSKVNLPLREAEGDHKHRARWVDPNVRAAQRDLERVLGVKVRIRDRKGKGKILIEYSTLEDFDRVVRMLKGK